AEQRERQRLDGDAELAERLAAVDRVVELLDEQVEHAVLAGENVRHVHASVPTTALKAERTPPPHGGRGGRRPRTGRGLLPGASCGSRRSGSRSRRAARCRRLPPP